MMFRIVFLVSFFYIFVTNKHLNSFTTAMFSIFNKKTRVDNIEWLGVDIHSHLLPGLDDGSPDLDTSLNLIQKLHEIGYHKFICTPHIFTELYPNSSETILPALSAVKNALVKRNSSVQIAAAAEYMIDESFKIHPGLLTMGDKFILIEMSYLNETPNIEQVIFNLQVKGYKVILAHPERYLFYHMEKQRFERLNDMGVCFQLNLLSVSGYYGKEVKKIAEYLLEKKYYDFAGTDLHHEKHLDLLVNSVTSGLLYEKLGAYPFKNKEVFL